MAIITRAFVQPIPVLQAFRKPALPRVSRRPRSYSVHVYPYRRLTTVLTRCTSAPSDVPPTSPTTTTSEQNTSQISSNATTQVSTKRKTPLWLLSLPLLTIPLLPFLPSIRPFLTSLTTLSASLPPARAALTVGITNYFTVLFCFPANMAFMIAAGALLGPLPAFIALFTSKFLAAVTAFLLARRLLRKRVTRWVDEKPRLAKVLSSSVADWRFVALLRLSPFPGFMLNYLLSLTGVRFWEYVVGTLLGTMPSVLNLVLVGGAARDVGRGIGGGGMNGGALGMGIRMMCTLAMVVVSIVIGRRVREVFREDSDVESAEA